MPHLIVEYSSNILEKSSMNELLGKGHKILVDHLPTNINNCKSRAIECLQYAVGDMNPKNAFIHVNLKILPGRGKKLIKKAKNHLIKLLESHFSSSMKNLNLQMTIEVSKLKTYSKVESKK